jgi:hypothetical protein
MMRSINLFVPLSFCLLFSFCKSGDKSEDTIIAAVDSTAQAVLETKLNAQNVFNSMPDRKEVLKLIEEHKIEYNSDFLNNPAMVSRYTVESSKAANLGIYGSDLSIASSFDQTQESMTFLRCVNILATDLGISNAFDQSMVDRMEANKQNKDSTLEIITGAFKSADEILKSNNRPATSAIILAGAWVEGLYVSCRMAESLNSESIVKSIVKQKESLKNLVVMLEASKLDEATRYILVDLKVLQDAYRSAEESGVITLESIKEISFVATALRKKMISAGV